MSDDTPHSGSRWEPTPNDAEAGGADPRPTAQLGQATMPGKVQPGPGTTDDVVVPSALPALVPRPRDEPITERFRVPTMYPVPRPWPVVLSPAPLGTPRTGPPRRNLRRAGLLAAAAAGLLLVGGAGGYAIGHASATVPVGAAGLAGSAGGFGHHRPSGADGGAPRGRGGDGQAGDGSTGGGTAAGGAGSTGPST